MSLFIFSGVGVAPVSLLFPFTLPGMKYDYLRNYEWNTGVQVALSGKRSTIAYRAYPLVHFEYEFEFLRDYNTELKSVVGLLNAVQGRAQTFLHTDPDFNTVTGQIFGMGDGSTTAFQIVATYANSGGAGAPELVQNFNGAPSIYINGSLQSSGYSVNGQGLVTFTTPPAGGAVLTWSGSFYYRCMFDEDHFNFKKFMNTFWNVSVKFTSCTL